MSKHIELIKKIKALADKGVGGEKETAQKMLSDLLKKHNLTIEDIDGDKTQDYFFNIKEESVRLWVQIVGRVNSEIKIYGRFPDKTIKDLLLKGNHMISCTPSEYIQIEAMFIFYSSLYEKELKVFLRAFCTANDLLVDGKGRTIDDLTPKELEELRRANAMSEKIKSETFRKQISQTL